MKHIPVACNLSLERLTGALRATIEIHACTYIYDEWTYGELSKVAKYIAENGVKAAVMKF